MYASNNMPYDVSAHLDKIARFYPIVQLYQNSVRSHTVSITEELLISAYIKYTEEAQQFIDALNAEATDRLNSMHDNDDDDEVIELLQMNNRQSEVFCLDDFHQAVGYLYRVLKCAVSMPISPQTLQILTQKFENQLDNLTDFIAQLPTAIRSPLFSLGRYLETLEKNYENQYDKVYWATAYFRRNWTFFKFRHPDRLDDIRFIMRVNMHIEADDKIRCAIMLIVIQKILLSNNESERSKETSILKQLLDIGLAREHKERATNTDIKAMSFFCEQHKKNLRPPENLQRELDLHRSSPQRTTYN